MEKKYLIMDDGRVLALRSFGHVQEGDIGGFVDGEHNLSHEGLCWVGDDASVTEGAGVIGDALCDGRAIVRHVAEVSGRAWVSDDCMICGMSVVTDDAIVGDEARIYSVRVGGREVVGGSTVLHPVYEPSNEVTAKWKL